MNISDNIKALYEAWKKAEDKVPDSEFAKGYKSREAKARKTWRLFDAACKESGLKAVEVSHTLNGFKDYKFKITS